MSVIARLAQLALSIFGCRGGSPDGAEFRRPIDKISTLVSNAVSLVSPAPESYHVGASSASPQSGIEDGDDGSGGGGDGFAFDPDDPAIQGLFDLMGDTGMDWPATLSSFTDDAVQMRGEGFS